MKNQQRPLVQLDLITSYILPVLEISLKSILFWNLESRNILTENERFKIYFVVTISCVKCIITIKQKVPSFPAFYWKGKTIKAQNLPELLNLWL